MAAAAAAAAIVGGLWEAEGAGVAGVRVAGTWWRGPWERASQGSSTNRCEHSLRGSVITSSAAGYMARRLQGTGEVGRGRIG